MSRVIGGDGSGQYGYGRHLGLVEQEAFCTHGPYTSHGFPVSHAYPVNQGIASGQRFPLPMHNNLAATGRSISAVTAVGAIGGVGGMAAVGGHMGGGIGGGTGIAAGGAGAGLGGGLFSVGGGINGVGAGCQPQPPFVRVSNVCPVPAGAQQAQRLVDLEPEDEDSNTYAGGTTAPSWVTAATQIVTGGGSSGVQEVDMVVREDDIDICSSTRIGGVSASVMSNTIAALTSRSNSNCRNEIGCLQASDNHRVTDTPGEQAQESTVTDNEGEGDIDALDVACSFVYQYYSMAHENPEELHRFYDADSRMYRGSDAHSECNISVVGQHEIQNVLQTCFHSPGATSRIRSIQADTIFGGAGIVLLITGRIKHTYEPPREFTQTVVLSRQRHQQHSWYVSSEIVCFLESDDSLVNTATTCTTTPTANMVPCTSSLVVNDLSHELTCGTGDIHSVPLNIEVLNMGGMMCTMESNSKDINETGLTSMIKTKVDNKDFERVDDKLNITVAGTIKGDVESEKVEIWKHESINDDALRMEITNIHVGATQVVETNNSFGQLGQKDNELENASLVASKSPMEPCLSKLDNEKFQEKSEELANRDMEKFKQLSHQQFQELSQQTSTNAPIQYKRENHWKRNEVEESKSQEKQQQQTWPNINASNSNETVKIFTLPDGRHYAPTSYAGKLFTNPASFNHPVKVGYAVPAPGNNMDSDEAFSGTNSVQVSGGERRNMQNKMWVSEIPEDMDDEEVKQAVLEQLAHLNKGYVLRVERVRDKSFGYLELDSSETMEILRQKGLFLGGRKVRVDYIRSSAGHGIKATVPFKDWNSTNVSNRRALASSTSGYRNYASGGFSEKPVQVVVVGSDVMKGRNKEKWRITGDHHLNPTNSNSHNNLHNHGIQGVNFHRNSYGNIGHDEDGWIDASRRRNNNQRLQNGVSVGSPGGNKERIVSMGSTSNRGLKGAVSPAVGRSIMGQYSGGKRSVPGLVVVNGDDTGTGGMCISNKVGGIRRFGGNESHDTGTFCVEDISTVTQCSSTKRSDADSGSIVINGYSRAFKGTGAGSHYSLKQSGTGSHSAAFKEEANAGTIVGKTD